MIIVIKINTNFDSNVILIVIVMSHNVIMST